MILLAIDTSTRILGLALYDGASLLTESIWTGKDNHSVELAPAVAQALERTGVSEASLGAVGVALGPGSFTSLRVGLAFAKGLCLANHLPLIGIPTLDVIANAQPVEDKPLVAILQAGRGRLAAGWYTAGRRNWRPNGKPHLITPEELVDRIESPTLVCGELSTELRRALSHKDHPAEVVSPARSARRPGHLAELAWARWQAGRSQNPATINPIYLHKI